MPCQVYSKSGVQQKGKTFVGVAEFDVPFDLLWTDIWDGLDGVPDWNQDVLEYKMLLKVRQITLTFDADET